MWSRDDVPESKGRFNYEDNTSVTHSPGLRTYRLTAKCQNVDASTNEHVKTRVPGTAMEYSRQLQNWG